MTMSAVVGALSALWGWMGWLVIGWVACMAIDYISGSAAAAKAGVPGTGSGTRPG